MPRAVYLLGAPGVGKTTLMTSLLAGFTREKFAKPPDCKVFGYEPLTVDGTLAGAHLGRTREAFSGTDALPLNVLPEAAHWAATSQLPELLLGEGPRLGHPRFLVALHERGVRVTVVHLTADPRLLDRRCAARGSTQDADWRRGSATRALNAFLRCCAAGLGQVQLDTTYLTPGDVARVVSAEALEPSTP